MSAFFQTGIIVLFAKEVRSISVSAVRMLFAEAASSALNLQKLYAIKVSAMTALNLHYSERKAWILTQMGYGPISKMCCMKCIV